MFGLRGPFRPSCAHRIFLSKNSLLRAPTRNPCLNVTPKRPLSVSNVAARGQSKFPRRVRSLIYAAVFGSLGYTVVDTFVERLSGEVPVPKSVEDEEALSVLRERFEKLPIVQDLRANPDYAEWEAYGNFTGEEKSHRLTSGVLNGSRGIGIQVRIHGNSHHVIIFFCSICDNIILICTIYVAEDFLERQTQESRIRPILW